MKFRAFFNEDSRSSEDCEQVVRDAVQMVDEMALDGDVNTIATDNGEKQNITVDFGVIDSSNADDPRSTKGRLNEYLMGSEGCDGLVRTD